MKCAKCGYDIYEGKVCPLCGHGNGAESILPSTEAVPVEVVGIESVDTKATSGYGEQILAESTYSMKWYKALLVFLWFGVVSNAVSAVMFFSGAMYQGFTDKVYAMLPTLKSLDSFGGLFSIVMAMFTFVVWLKLKNYKAHAPELLTAMYVLNTVFLIGYTFMFYNTIGGAETTIIYGDSYIQGMYEYQEYLDLSEISFSASDLRSIAGSIVMLFANRTYFKKRANLFKY